MFFYVVKNCQMTNQIIGLRPVSWKKKKKEIEKLSKARVFKCDALQCATSIKFHRRSIVLPLSNSIAIPSTYNLDLFVT
jgi:hypothetical protein